MQLIVRIGGKILKVFVSKYTGGNLPNSTDENVKKTVRFNL